MIDTASEHAAALYQTLKKYCADVHRDKRLSIPPADSVTVHSPQCGSQLTLDARIDDHRIREVGYKVRACSLGQATTAIVAHRAIGLDASAVQGIAAQLRAILSGEDAQCDWPELEVFAAAKDMPSRHGSALLPFEALQELFDRAGKSAGSVGTDANVTTKLPGRS